MCELIKHIVAYKNKKEDEDFECIERILKPSLIKKIINIPFKNQEDLYQQIMMSLNDFILDFRLIEIIELNENNKKHFISFLEKIGGVDIVNRDIDIFSKITRWILNYIAIKILLYLY